MNTARSRASRRIGLLLGSSLLAGGCATASGSSSDAPWLAADAEARRLQLERQLRGFDVAMMETGYRYVELYWAGRDGNWEAAAYHAGKIRLAIENGLERRPKRGASARPFLAGPLVAIEQAAAARDAVGFAARFADLTAGCNACHAMEKVPFFEVRPPTTRISPVHYEAEAARE